MLKGQYSFLPITVSWPIDVKHPPLKKPPFMGIMNVPVHLRTVLPWVWLQNTKDKFNWYGYIVVKFILFSKTKFISSASKILKKKKKCTTSWKYSFLQQIHSTKNMNDFWLNASNRNLKSWSRTKSDFTKQLCVIEKSFASLCYTWLSNWSNENVSIKWNI